jgi:PAS domain S-box-containing protein
MLLAMRRASSFLGRRGFLPENSLALFVCPRDFDLMFLSRSFNVHRLATRLQRLQDNRYLGLGVTIAGVALATLTRWAIGAYVLDRIPFTTYYPAIVAAALIGGFWAGLFSVILSGLAAWFFFMPPAFEFSIDWAGGVALFTFIFVALLLVALVTALNSAIRLLRNETEQRRRGELALHRLAAIVASSDDAIVAKDLNGIITEWNAGAQRLFGYAADEAIGKHVSMLIPSDRHNEEPSILERLRSGQRVDHYETVRRHKDGSLVDISLTVSPITDAYGTIVGASKIARDITEQKRATAQQEMLVREMSHRIKNAFAVVNGIVGLSASSAEMPIVLRIQERLGALARAQDLTRPGLLGTEWGASYPTTFKTLARAIFEPYVALDAPTATERLIVEGPDLPLAHSSITGLALLLHELATNAVKCGSLSSSEGRVRIELSAADGEFLMTWTEEGGPEVSGPPEHAGFGSSLAHRIVTGQFGGKIFYDWKRDGLVVRVTAPRLATIEKKLVNA